MEAFQVRIYTCQFHDYKSPEKQESDLMLLHLVELSYGVLAVEKNHYALHTFDLTDSMCVYVEQIEK